MKKLPLPSYATEVTVATVVTVVTVVKVVTIVTVVTVVTKNIFHQKKLAPKKFCQLKKIKKIVFSQQKNSSKKSACDKTQKLNILQNSKT